MFEASNELQFYIRIFDSLSTTICQFTWFALCHFVCSNAHVCQHMQIVKYSNSIEFLSCWNRFIAAYSFIVSNYSTSEEIQLQRKYINLFVLMYTYIMVKFIHFFVGFKSGNIVQLELDIIVRVDFMIFPTHSIISNWDFCTEKWKWSSSAY